MNTSKVSRRDFLKISLATAAFTGIGGYSLFQYSNTLKITHRQIHTGKLSKPLKILHFSDLHLGPLTPDELVDKAFSYMKQVKADIICFTGDVIHYGPEQSDRLFDYFPELTSKYGSYSVLGNHDYIDGSKSELIRKNFAQTDFKLLINDFIKLDYEGNKIFISGIDDLYFGNKNYDNAFKFNREKNLNILLAHNAKNIDTLTSYNPDIILSGHTHGGQIYIPYLLNPLYSKFCNPKYIKGLFKVKNSHLFVTTGIGNGIFKIPGKIPAFSVCRFLSPPEIAIITVT